MLSQCKPGRFSLNSDMMGGTCIHTILKTMLLFRDVESWKDSFGLNESRHVLEDLAMSHRASAAVVG